MKSSVVFCLAASAAARVMDLPTIQSSLSKFSTGLGQIAETFAAITPANVNSQVDKAASQIVALGKANKGTGAALKSSGPIKLNDISGLLGVVKEAAPTLQKLATDVLAKREIINQANQADKLKTALLNPSVKDSLSSV